VSTLIAFGKHAHIFTYPRGCGFVGPLWIRHKTATPTMHAILAKSGYNHNKHLTQQHVPRKIMEKLPKVVLA